MNKNGVKATLFQKALTNQTNLRQSCYIVWVNQVFSSSELLFGQTEIWTHQWQLGCSLRWPSQTSLFVGWTENRKTNVQGQNSWPRSGPWCIESIIQCETIFEMENLHLELVSKPVEACLSYHKNLTSWIWASQFAWKYHPQILFINHSYEFSYSQEHNRMKRPWLGFRFFFQ